jgi:hypothetical protein
MLNTSTAPKRLLLATGWLLVFAGLFHLAVWLASGQPWEGSVSWRKPALFGVSGGFTLVSLGLLYKLLAPQRWDIWLAGTLGGAMSFEVSLISIQQWRGLESHFNRSTPLDGFIETLITLLITVVTLCIVILSVRAFRFLDTTDDKKIAWRSGLVFLLISCAIGFVIFGFGVWKSSFGGDPTRFGNDGVVKFPHGMTIHAIQVLPCLCWLMTRVGVTAASRVNSLRCLNISFKCLLCFSVVQTISGRARSDLTIFSGGILVATAAFAAPLMIAIGRALARKFTSRRLAASRVTL